MENSCCLEEYYSIYVLLRGKSFTKGSFTLLFASETKYIVLSCGILRKAGFKNELEISVHVIE